MGGCAILFINFFVENDVFYEMKNGSFCVLKMIRVGGSWDKVFAVVSQGFRSGESKWVSLGQGFRSGGSRFSQWWVKIGESGAKNG